MTGSLRAKRTKVELKDLPIKDKLETVISRTLLNAFEWLFVLITVVSLLSACALLVLVMYKVYCGQYTDAVKLCVVLVTMVLINIVVEPPERKV